jgi:uncharacterized glyoxalase superfamily protein PhnB
MSAPICSVLRYRDAPFAIEWLCKAFGFEVHLSVPGDGPDQIAHAQLTFGGSMIMLSTWRDDEIGALQTIPDALAGRVTASVYVVVDDADAHHSLAESTGARVILPPRDQPNGGRGYTCRDPEGHVWSFGTYNPWVQPEAG